MSNISGLLGTAGGFKGTGVDSPDMNYVSPEQLNQSFQQNQAALGQQTSLLGALQGQNGLANQSSVYNQMQGVANGTGPNPAQAQLAQATGANTANQAALMAGQRGSSQNAGLIARQAAMQGGANQQNAAGQAATLQAQQSLGALGQMGGMANTMASNQIGQTNANAASAQAEQSSLLNANNAQNNQRSGLINATAGQQASFGGGMANGIGSAMGSSAGAQGGRVENMPKMAGGGMLGKIGGMFSSMMAEGGDVEQSAFQGQSKFGQYLHGVQDGGAPQAAQIPDLSKAGQSLGKGIKNQMGSTSDNSAADANSADMEPAMAKGGKVPVLLSPGEKKLTPEQAKAAAAGKIDPMKAGKTIPGKPKVGGAKNDYANDTYKSEEEPGTLILPRSVTKAKNPHWAAMRFVHAHMMANGGKIPMKPKGNK